MNALSNHIAALEAAGVAISNHESDLYCQDTPLAREIVEKAGYRFTTFVNSAPPHVGEAWLDVHFAYTPWWEARMRKEFNAKP